MNRTAEALDMSSSHFENPHGLTAAGHKSTAKDMAKLAWSAYQLPEFGKYVQTRQRGCALVGPGEYRRNVVWKNTNRLLGTKGYLGIKTGTTSAAGACLISMSQRGDRTILLVTLGSATSATRYTDSRNLYRWLWLNPPQRK
jgi:D-alanyl-D-alanine carboxypeptidase (penicillin-binding protein 5/6)